MWLQILHHLWAEFEYVHNQCYVSKILQLLLTLWLLFGLIWLRPDKVIIGTNFIIWQIGLTFTRWLSRNEENAVFVEVTFFSATLMIFFMILGCFLAPSWIFQNSYHYCLNWEQRQIDTNTIFGHVMSLHQLYSGEYFQIFSSQTAILFHRYGPKDEMNESINLSLKRWVDKNESLINQGLVTRKSLINQGLVIKDS
jgi:hypothetical protein